jgi:hypothetical protein
MLWLEDNSIGCRPENYSPATTRIIELEESTQHAGPSRRIRIYPRENAMTLDTRLAELAALTVQKRESPLVTYEMIAALAKACMEYRTMIAGVTDVTPDKLSRWTSHIDTELSQALGGGGEDE